MEMKIVGITVAILVSITVLAGVLMPVLDDATAKTDTYVNKGYFYVDSIDGDDSINYHYENGVLTINGVEVPAPSDSTYPEGITIFFTEHISVRMDNGLIRIKGQVNQGCSAIDLTATSGSITGTYTYGSGPTTSTASWTYTKFVGMVTTDTDRVMSQPVPQYVHSDSLIDTTGFTRAANINEYYVISVSGTIDDGVTVNLYTQGAGSPVTLVTVSDAKINYTPVEGHDDLYLVDNITFTLTKDSASDNVTYSIYTVPAEVTADRTDPMSDNEIAILAAVPIMIIVAILLGVIALIIRSRMD